MEKTTTNFSIISLHLSGFRYQSPSQKPTKTTTLKPGRKKNPNNKQKENPDKQFFSPSTLTQEAKGRVPSSCLLHNEHGIYVRSARVRYTTAYHGRKKRKKIHHQTLGECMGEAATSRAGCKSFNPRENDSLRRSSLGVWRREFPRRCAR